MTDQQIIEHIKKRDNDRAFSAIYHSFPAIKKMIILNNGKEEDAEDIFQEALIILCDKVRQPNFVLSSKLSTYMYGICNFLWKDELRKKQKLPSFSMNENFDTQAESSTDNELEEVEKGKLAEKIINELGERCKELLLLFYTSNLKLKDIALKMGYSSENTAKNQKYKCLEAAKKNLKELQPNYTV